MENTKSLGYWYSFEFDETSGIYYGFPANKDKEAETGSSVERCSACCVKSTGRTKKAKGRRDP